MNLRLHSAIASLALTSAGLLAATLACGEASPVVPSLPTRSAKTMVDVMPRGGVPLVGTIDFDLLDPVVGNGCGSYADTEHYDVDVAGFSEPGEADYAGRRLTMRRIGGSGDPVERAEAAAVYDALAKIKDADAFLLTRVTTEKGKDEKWCATVYGRPLRFKKGQSASPEEAARRAAPPAPPAPKPAEPSPPK